MSLACGMPPESFYFRRAKVIDYWVIGIDEDNTDNSPEIIRQHVGHIPGEIVTVSQLRVPGSMHLITSDGAGSLRWNGADVDKAHRQRVGAVP